MRSTNYRKLIKNRKRKLSKKSLRGGKRKLSKKKKLSKKSLRGGVFKKYPDDGYPSFGTRVYHKFKYAIPPGVFDAARNTKKAIKEAIKRRLRRKQRPVQNVTPPNDFGRNN